MKKRLATGYTFSASAKTIVHADFSDIGLAGIQLITNTTDQIIIYSFADTTKGGTLSTDTLTLEYDTGTMSDTDELMILVEDGVASQAVTGTFYQATQPVSIATMPSTPVTGTFYQATQPVSLATLPVTNAGTFATQSTLAAETTKVIGTVNQGTSPWVVSGAVTNTVLSVVGAGAAATAQRVQLSDESLAALENITVISTATDLDIRNLTNTDVVTAELSATDNAVLDVIAAKDFATQTTLALIKAKTDNIPALGQALAAASVPVILPTATISTLTPPAAITGFATSAKQLADGHTVALSATDNAVLDTIYTATNTVAGAVSATHMQVDVLTAPTLTVNAHAVTNAGTFVSQENGAALTALQLIDNIVSGAGVNMTQLNGVNVLMGNGVTGTGSQRVTIASDNTAFSVNATLAGSSELIFRSIDLDETEEEVKATAATLYGWYIFNAAAVTQYVKLYNLTAANTTVGTSTPVMTIPVPAGAAANVEFTNGIAFATALSAAATTGVADADTGAPAANSLVVNILYK